MKRREAREQAFVLVFERSFKEETLDSIIEEAVEGRNLEIDSFARGLASCVYEHIIQLDAVIEQYSHKWNVNRLSRVVLSILRLAVCEILYFEEIPASVSINEAVELAKKYADEEAGSYVNGFLGGFVRDQEQASAPAKE